MENRGCAYATRRAGSGALGAPSSSLLPGARCCLTPDAVAPTATEARSRPPGSRDRFARARQRHGRARDSCPSGNAAVAADLSSLAGLLNCELRRVGRGSRHPTVQERREEQRRLEFIPVRRAVLRSELRRCETAVWRTRKPDPPSSALRQPQAQAPVTSLLPA